MFNLKKTQQLFGAVIFAALLSAVSGMAQQKSFTLEQVMSSPFPDGLIAAPAGGKLAWVFNTAGARNVWIAEPTGDSTGYKARPLTTYSSDDGMEIGELSWAPDASAIVFARGGDFENGGEYPNPRSFPGGVEQKVLVVAQSGGEPRQLAEGHSPAVSPKGDSVAYVYKDQIWLVKISGSGKPEQLIHSKGKVDSLRWSPDGARLAFVSSRGDHTFIGVYDFQNQGLRYLDPSVDRDREPVWSRDGKQIAFIRIPASREAFAFGPKRAAQPWSIRIADVATGVGREVWKADEGKGSAFHGVPADNEILWGAGDRLVFPWKISDRSHCFFQSGSRRLRLTHHISGHTKMKLRLRNIRQLGRAFF